MPRIFDNIEQELLPALRQTLEISSRADFCVGYFNLRGWKSIDQLIDGWEGSVGNQCRLLVGMQRLPQDDLREAYSLLPHEDQMSNQAVIRLKCRLAEEFRIWFKYLPANASSLSAWVHNHHPHAVPQWIEISTENVGEKYLSWAMANSTSLPFQQTKSP